MTFRGLTVWNSNEGNQTGEESGNIDDNLGDDDSLLNCNVYTYKGDGMNYFSTIVTHYCRRSW